MKDYDWRGIAMLTQQMGQLFEPSKARLMSKQHEHEMNVLFAKKAWEAQSQRLDQQKLQYTKITDEIKTYAHDLQGKNLKDLVTAGLKDGALPEDASEVYEKTDGKKLQDMQALASQYQAMIREQQGVLDNMVLYDNHAKMGEGWVKSYKSNPTVKKQVDYYIGADKDNVPGLSYQESQQALNRYLKDTYLPEEGEEGMEVTVGKGLDGKDDVFQVRPEAVAFMAGFNSTFDRNKKETGQAIAVSRASEKIYEKTYPKTSDRELKKRYINNMNTISSLNTKYVDLEKVPIGTYLEIVDGSYMPKDWAKLQGYDQNDVSKYIAARTVIDKDAYHLNLRQLPIDMNYMVTLDTDGMTVTETMIEEFGANDPNQMYNQILLSSDKQGYEDTLANYKEFIQRYDSLDKDKRRYGIDKFNKWLAN